MYIFAAPFSGCIKYIGMMKLLFCTLATIGLHVSLNAQDADSVNTAAGPRGGLNNLALLYYKIDFTPGQRQRLEDVPLEFIYSISEEGVATLEEVNGINDPVIIDSIKNQQPLPEFYPRIVNGRAQSSIYFMKIQFPKYTMQRQRLSRYTHTEKLTLDDFEYIHKSGRRMDILLGAVVNSFAGNAQEYLKTGGGFKVDLMYVGEKGIGAGLVMSVYGNSHKKPYPINTTRELDKSSPTLLLGAGINKSMHKKERSEWLAQVELCYAMQNISSKVNNKDKDYIMAKGFSPGVVLHYLLQVGKDNLYTYYGNPAMGSHYLNFHAAIRPVFFDLKPASGVMFELGVSYRFSWITPDDYKFKM